MIVEIVAVGTSDPYVLASTDVPVGRPATREGEHNVCDRPESVLPQRVRPSGRTCQLGP